MNINQVVVARPRAWPWFAALFVLSLAWTAHVMYENFQHWQATDLIEPMGAKIRNGILGVAAMLALAYAAVWGSASFGNPTKKEAVNQSVENARNTSSQTEPVSAILTASGAKYVLEARSLGLVVNRDADDEIWKKIEKKADNFASILSQNAGDYASSRGLRTSRYSQASGFAFREAAGRAVEYWPIPTIIWGPPRHPENSYRAAADISGNRQQAGLGVHLFLWADDANAADGAAMIAKVFDFFDKHPDVPAALIFCEDSDIHRFLVGPKRLSPEGGVVPTVPDSLVGILVSRSDRVDKLIRPFAVDQSQRVNKEPESDVRRLWKYYWNKSHDQGPEGFDAFYMREMVAQGYADPNPVNTMRAEWWQQHLPDFWKQISNRGPGEFKPSPYIPVRWTTWQVAQFDKAPLIGYLHRPIDVKLTNDEGKPLPNREQVAALKAGWQAAVDTLEPTMAPKRVFYDTTSDRRWVIPINQALLQVGEHAPDLDDVNQGFDIGRRIANTGVSSPMVQLALGLIASYQEGGASATINLRPNGDANIIMVSPPDAATKAAWLEQHGGHNPF